MRVVLSLLLLCCCSLLLAACQTNNPLALPTDTPAPPTSTPQATASPTPLPGSIAGFDDFLIEAEARKPDQRQELVNRFVGSLAQSPITGGEEAIFLYRGAAQSVQIVGDMNNWNAGQAGTMTRLEGSDLWFWRATVEPDARLDYRILIDSREIALDPLNPNTSPGAQGPNSELQMPEYQMPPELAPATGSIPSGTLSSHTLDSQFLGQTRTFQVYEPPGQIIGQPLPSLYINNGSDYLNLIDTPAILDRLIAQRQIPPLLAVFVTPINAGQDYSLNEAYAAFLAEELAPYVQETFGASADPANIGILGNSLGGLAAAHALMAYPDVFGLAVSHSGRFGHEDSALIQSAGRRQTGPTSSEAPQFYLVVGSYETAVGVDGEQENILERNRAMAAALERSGFNHTLHEQPEGHSWGLWRGTLGRALAALYQPLME
jgi:enterochelin esterase family protein